ncbi:hypothetical protein COCON_G00195450 [Conger conger]|uniref:Uncharacterized protein n=1 Tax=Conger conger TaxID=82655 RepID=A0A9Q1D0N6_CONCO|nr:hypothetical protein COCON_G00195450 [Conger conger]
MRRQAQPTWSGVTDGKVPCFSGPSGSPSHHDCVAVKFVHGAAGSSQVRQVSQGCLGFRKSESGCESSTPPRSCPAWGRQCAARPLEYRGLQVRGELKGRSAGAVAPLQRVGEEDEPYLNREGQPLSQKELHIYEETHGLQQHL